MKTYIADRLKYGTAVMVDTGRHRYQLPHICRHSPDGFEWGYGGSGPADLALSILTDAVGPELAEKRYQAFKWAFIANLLKYEPWTITLKRITDWIRWQEKGVSEEAEELPF